MCWADRAGIAATVVILFVMNVMANHFSPEFLLEIALRLCLPIWVGLRIVDWATGGPARRAHRLRSEQT